MHLPQTGEAISSTQVATLPDHYPQVTFDVSLGKKYENVDFDYNSFAEEANRLGVAPEDIDKLSINIGAKLPGKNGVYYPKNVTIDIAAKKTANKTLSHEIQHFSDDLQGNLIFDPRIIIGDIATRASLPTSLTSLGLSVGYHARYIGAEITSAGVATCFMVAGAAIWGYSNHPIEKRAEQAAKDSTAKIITLDPRP